MNGQTPVAAPKPRPAKKGARSGRLPVEIGAPRWALVSDGTLALLGTDMVIPKEHARALIEFLRTLDQGQA